MKPFNIIHLPGNEWSARNANLVADPPGPWGPTDGIAIRNSQSGGSEGWHWDGTKWLFRTTKNMNGWNSGGLDLSDMWNEKTTPWRSGESTNMTVGNTPAADYYWDDTQFLPGVAP